MSTTKLDKLLLTGLSEETTSKPILVWNPVTKRVSWKQAPIIDNIKIEIPIACPATPTIDNFVAAINALPTFSILESQIPTFKAVSTGTEPITYFVELLGTGKGKYGVGGIVLTTTNLKITSQGSTSGDIAALSSTQIIDLGYNGSANVDQVLNAKIPNITIQDQATGYVLVKGIFTGGNAHEYLFLGVGGVYGIGHLQSTITDFAEMNAYLNVPKATDNLTGTVKTDTYKADPVVYVKETVDELLKAKANYFLDIKNITGITYNVILTDILNELVYAGTLPMNVIIPNNTTVPFPIGSIFYTLGTNTGIITASGGTGVTLSLKAGLSLSAIQNEVRQYTKIGINTWSVRGDLNLGAVTQTELSYLQGATSNLQAQINAKTALSGGVANRLMMWLTTTTATISRIWDTGTFIGIGTVNTPTKDLTFGNQADREIGIEKSDNTVNGKSLIIRAGKTVNYLDSNLFLPLNLTVKRNFYAMTVKANGDVYAASVYGNLCIKFNGTVDFIDQGVYMSITWCMRVAPNGDVYRATDIGIFIQTGGVGPWSLITNTIANCHSLCIAPNNDVYVGTYGGDIWVRTGGTGSFIATGQVSKVWDAMTALPNGDILAFSSGILYKRTAGTGNFVQVSATNYGTVQNMDTSPTNGNVYAIRAEGLSVIVMDYSTGVWSTINQSFSTYNKPIALTSNGSVYAVASDNDVYFQNNDQLGTSNLDGGTLKNIAGTGKGTGKSRFEVWTGQKQPSGTNMQVETLREYIDENGHHIYTSIPVYADNAAALVGGLPVGCEYRTATGIKMIVY
jgi:hypothetical protein